MGTIGFFKESIKNIKTTGTITRSSRFLCKDMVSHVDFDNAKSIVELGAGDGVITKHILRAMRPEAELLSFEILDELYKPLSAIEDKRLHAIKDSAEKVGEYLSKYNLGEADAVISALPFVAFPEELTINILRETHKHMKPGAKFIQVNYSLLMKKVYKGIFGNVRVHFSPINIPPAFVLVCEKK